MAEGKQGAQEAWRAYLELALGVTEASRKKAQKVAKRLAGKGGATAQQLQSLADNLVSTSLANREALTKLVRFEVDRALGAVGLATADEVAELQRRVQELERQVGTAGPAARAAAAQAAAAAPAPAAAQASAGAPAKKAVAKKTVAKKTTRTVGTTAVAKTAVAKKAVARRAPAKKAVAKKVTPPPPAGMGPE
jgi:polyhydroxyalkanoate synthesis regulator phasin